MPNTISITADIKSVKSALKSNKKDNIAIAYFYVPSDTNYAELNLIKSIFANRKHYIRFIHFDVTNYPKLHKRIGKYFIYINGKRKMTEKMSHGKFCLLLNSIDNSHHC